MPGSHVWKCDCGIEWKTFHSDDNKEKQVHVCTCGRTHEVTAVITRLFYSPTRSLQISEAWSEVPQAEFKEHLTPVA